MARVLVLAAILAVWLSAPARAGVATMDGIDVMSWMTFKDTEGVPDDLHVTSPDEDTVILLGPTVVAGKGCVPVPGGASCSHPLAGTDFGHGWDLSRIDLGGGDDTVVVEATQVLAIDGGDGNDRDLARARRARLGAGPCRRRHARRRRRGKLEGGPGNDELSAGAGSSAAGGHRLRPAHRLAAERAAHRRGRSRRA